MLGCVQQEIEAHVRGGDARTTHQDSDRFRQIADPFSKTSRFWSLFTQWVCSLATTPPQLAAPPPPNGGNCIIRAATRRRYSASQLLMLQNPHRFPCGEQRRGRMARLRCPWAPEGPEGTGELQNAGPGRGAGGRWQGPAGQRVDAQSHTSATQRRRCVGRRKARPRCRWAVAGPGRASRSTTPSAARVWLSRGRAAAHRHTQRPGPARQATRRPEHPWGNKPQAAPRHRTHIQKRPPETGWAYLSRLWESNPRPIHYE